jgi:predicted DNA repair protein MutK
MDAKALEDAKVAGAIRTDLILSAEIMAITLGAVADAPMMNRAVVLAVVGIGITILVYGVVALIVKADDAGVALARPRNPAFVRAIGRGLVLGMPGLLRLLGSIGTAAMLWVGGGIVIHGLETYGVAEPGHSLHGLALSAGSGAGAAGGVVAWLVNATGAGLIGLVLGAMIVAALHLRASKTIASGHPNE